MKNKILNISTGMKLIHQFFLLALLAAAMMLSNPAQAQFGEGVVNDPYKKPHLWEKLKVNPNDSTLWADYMGKRWGAMTPREKATVAQWKQELYMQAIADQESIMGTQDKKTKNDAAPEAFNGIPVIRIEAKRLNNLTPMEAKQLAGVEAIIMQERDDIRDLKSNVSQNFVIIEDTYREIFADYGMTYRYYAEVHPDGKYSEQKWIEEQETLIRLYKVQKVKELRQQFSIVK